MVSGHGTATGPASTSLPGNLMVSTLPAAAHGAIRWDSCPVDGKEHPPFSQAMFPQMCPGLCGNISLLIAHSNWHLCLNSSRPP